MTYKFIAAALATLLLSGCGSGRFSAVSDPTAAVNNQAWPSQGMTSLHRPVVGDMADLLTMEPGVPFNGCILGEQTAYGGRSAASGCEVTMASLRNNAVMYSAR